ncbi:ASB11, partial [Symbiodinium pilosum]
MGLQFTYPLHVAVQQKDREMISLLLRFGANPNRRDSWGKTALDYGSDDEEVVRAFAK